jgi:hypothetical protein
MSMLVKQKANARLESKSDAEHSGVGGGDEGVVKFSGVEEETSGSRAQAYYKEGTLVLVESNA